MRRASGVAISLVVVSWVSAPSFAQPAEPLPAATEGRDAPDAAPPLAAAPAPPLERQPWKERLDREPLPKLEPERRWYGWQTLLVDALSVGASVLTVAATQDLEGGLWLGVALVTIGSPLVHFAHLNVEQGFTSLGARALPSGLVAIGLAINEEREGVLLGMIGVIGAGIVVIVDAAVLAWDEPRKAPLTRLTPWLDPQHGRIGLAYASSF